VTRRRIALAVMLVLVALFAWPAGGLLIGYYRLMAVRSDSMTPTLARGDRFVAVMRRPDELRRGDIVLVDAGARGIWVKRVAGLPGDRVEVVAGILHLNGRPVAPRFVREDIVAHDPVRGSRARRFAEQFPGEAEPHEIYDAGSSPGDDMPEQTIAPGHVFLLGDNRDDSMDSRWSSVGHGSVLGLGQVPLDRVLGVPWFQFDWAELGRPAGH
jgi:signal peptidase I